MIFPTITEHELSPLARGRLQAVGGQQLARSMRLFYMGEVKILMSRDDFARGDLRWHISLSCEDRDPTWDEIKHVQNALKPGVFFCIPMPPREYWMSFHPHAFHLEETKDRTLIEHWKSEAL